VKKYYKYTLLIITVVIFVFLVDKYNELLHIKLLDQFEENYNYFPLSAKDQISNQKFYCEYLDSFERMWYQYEVLNFLNDSTFQISTKTAYFHDYIFPIKYYLGLLNFNEWENQTSEKYFLSDIYVFKFNSDSLFGILTKDKDKIIFKYERQ
jgi:hypothetical protein